MNLGNLMCAKLHTDKLLLSGLSVGTFNNTNITFFTSQYKLVVYLLFTSHGTIACIHTDKHTNGQPDIKIEKDQFKNTLVSRCKVKALLIVCIGPD